MVFSTPANYLSRAGDGAVAKVLASQQCGTGANSGVDTMSEMSLFFILSLTLSGFFSGYSSFFLSSKTRNGKRRTTTNMYVDMLPLDHYIYSLLKKLPILSNILLYAF